MTESPGIADSRITSAAGEVPAIRSYTVGFSLSTPTPEVMFPCESKSTSRVFLPSSARYAPILMAEVVLPTPPFWFTKTKVFPISGYYTGFSSFVKVSSLQTAALAKGLMSSLFYGKRIIGYLIVVDVDSFRFFHEPDCDIGRGGEYDFYYRFEQVIRKSHHDENGMRVDAGKGDEDEKRRIQKLSDQRRADGARPQPFSLRRYFQAGKNRGVRPFAGEVRDYACRTMRGISMRMLLKSS